MRSALGIQSGSVNEIPDDSMARPGVRLRRRLHRLHVVLRRSPESRASGSSAAPRDDRACSCAATRAMPLRPGTLHRFAQHVSAEAATRELLEQTEIDDLDCPIAVDPQLEVACRRALDRHHVQGHGSDRRGIADLVVGPGQAIDPVILPADLGVEEPPERRRTVDRRARYAARYRARRRASAPTAAASPDTYAWTNCGELTGGPALPSSARRRRTARRSPSRAAQPAT